MLRDIETLLKAAADGTRLRILTLLRDQTLCVCQLVEVLGLPQSTISKHLFLLKHAGLVENEQRGKWTFYSLAASRAGDLRHGFVRLLDASLRDDPRVDADRSRVGHPKVTKLVTCCPPRPPVNRRRRPGAPRP
jgi:ArsR family transcriptional regulator